MNKKITARSVHHIKTHTIRFGQNVHSFTLVTNCALKG
jgi:hypothetical protein